MYKKCTSNSYIYTKKFTNYKKLEQSSNQKQIETWNVCFLYIQTMYKLYKNLYIQLANWNSFCMFFVHTNNVQTIQNLYNWNSLCMFIVHTNNVQIIQNVYKC